MNTPRRARGLLSLLLGLLGLALAAPPAGAQAGESPRVTVVRLVGAIDRAYASYLRGELDRAAERDDALVVLVLRGSGAVEVDVPALVDAVRGAGVPVVAWVGPVDLGETEAVAGAHTAIWLAADMRLVAHGARVRSMAPLERGGGDDAVALDLGVAIPSALTRRGGELTEREALDTGLATFVPRSGDGEGRIVDGTVNSLPDVVRAANGRLVQLGALDEVTVRNANPGLGTKVRQALGTNPTLVYLLLLVGAGAVVFELFQPGFGPAGYAGLLLVALAGYGLWALPASPLGVGLTVLALAALALDVARGGLGPLTWGGTALLVAGSRLLVESEGPALRVPWPWVATGVVGSWVFYVVVMTVVLRALRGQPERMGRALVGRVGEVRSTLNPQGHVLVEGALWRARALEWDGPVGTGTKVTVTGVDEDALVLDVAPVDERG